MAVAPVRPGTATGTVERFMVLGGAPSWPNPLAPQHQTLPPVRSAQKSSVPAATARIPLMFDTRANAADEKNLVESPVPS